jgi:predicted outer membrane repeat protein
VYSTNFYGTTGTLTSIVASNFTNNFAYGNGGAVYALDQILQLNASRFTENYVFPQNSYFTESPSQGGAVYVSPSMSSSVIIDCDFVGNVASSGWGGAIFGVNGDDVSSFLFII